MGIKGRGAWLVPKARLRGGGSPEKASKNGAESKTVTKMVEKQERELISWLRVCVVVCVRVCSEGP